MNNKSVISIKIKNEYIYVIILKKNYFMDGDYCAIFENKQNKILTYNEFLNQFKEDKNIHFKFINFHDIQDNYELNLICENTEEFNHLIPQDVKSKLLFEEFNEDINDFEISDLNKRIEELSKEEIEELFKENENLSISMLDENYINNMPNEDNNDFKKVLIDKEEYFYAFYNLDNMEDAIFKIKHCKLLNEEEKNIPEVNMEIIFEDLENNL